MSPLPHPYCADTSLFCLHLIYPRGDYYDIPLPWSIPSVYSSFKYIHLVVRRGIYILYFILWIRSPHGGLFWGFMTCGSLTVLVPSSFSVLDPSWSHLHVFTSLYWQHQCVALVQSICDESPLGPLESVQFLIVSCSVQFLLLEPLLSFLMCLVSLVSCHLLLSCRSKSPGTQYLTVPLGMSSVATRSALPLCSEQGKSRVHHLCLPFHLHQLVCVSCDSVVISSC